VNVWSAIGSILRNTFLDALIPQLDRSIGIQDAASAVKGSNAKENRKEARKQRREESKAEREEDKQDEKKKDKQEEAKAEKKDGTL